MLSYAGDKYIYVLLSFGEFNYDLMPRNYSILNLLKLIQLLNRIVMEHNKTYLL